MYRIKQFFAALAARRHSFDEQELDLLTPNQQELFRRMAPNDQRHSTEVCATLRETGNDDPGLLVAALLHDVGKSAGPIWLWQRTLIVLLEHRAPTVLNWLARGQQQHTVPWWRRGFVLNRHHPELGARWAAEVGCLPMTVALIRRHQEPVRSIETNEDRLLAALQRADGVN